jgi:hypothetical protein
MASLGPEAFVNAVSAGSGPRTCSPIVVKQNAKHLAQPVGRDRVRHVAQRQVCRSEGNAQIARGQQHHRQSCVAALRQELGMPAERNAGIVDDALVQRRGDQCAIAAPQAAINGMP